MNYSNRIRLGTLEIPATTMQHLKRMGVTKQEIREKLIQYGIKKLHEEFRLPTLDCTIHDGSTSPIKLRESLPFGFLPVVEEARHFHRSQKTP